MQQRSLKIYKPQDIEGLLNIDELKLKTTQECNDLLEQTRKKCEVLEKETYDAALDKLHKEQLSIFEKSYKKVDAFFEGAKIELNSVLKVVFDKIKMDENSVKILTNLLYVEIEKLKIKSNKMIIYANGHILPTLQANIKEEYAANEGVYFDYEIKQDLSEHECLIESDYVMVRISVADFQEKVLKIITGNNKID
ncbi:MAG: hypothetical protein V4591_10395 [Bdellovibrionota bacterium]